MSVQTYNELIIIPLGEIFKNITNENSHNLFNGPLTINFLLNDYIFVNNQFFYRNYNIINEIVYETKDKTSCVTLGDFKLFCPTKELNPKYIANCRKKYKKRNYLLKRTDKINNEIERVNNIENKIKTEIIDNLNFTKSQRKSHYRNCKNKILGKKSYSKPLFLYQLHEHDINDTTKTKLITDININLNLKVQIDKNVCLEKLFIYFTICKILKNIELYKNYLSCSIENINKNIFYLNKKYCMFNDVLEDRICEKEDDLDKFFSEYYIFKDFNTYAIDNKNKCRCLGYVLALSNEDNKWNVFPKNNDNSQHYISSDNIDNMLNIIKTYEKEGINLLENYLK
jgi:adenylate kinase family enzyme